MQVSVEFSKRFSLARLLARTKWFASLVFSPFGLISFPERRKPCENYSKAAADSRQAS